MSNMRSVRDEVFYRAGCGMNSSQAQTIIFLLFAILLVLLFGAAVILQGAAAIVVIFIGLTVLIIVFSVILTIASEIFTETATIVRQTPSIIRAVPNVIRAVPGFFQSFLRGWVKIVTAPVAGPADYWREMRCLRAGGGRVNPAIVVVGTIYKFFVGLMMSYFAIILPALAIYFIIQAALELT